MKLHDIIWTILIGSILQAQDNSLIVSKSFVVLDDNKSSTLNVQNKSGDDINISTMSMIGAHSSEFSILSEDCTSELLKDGDICNVEVKFEPKSSGVKNALLHIPYNDKYINVFLTNYEDTTHNVTRRVTPDMYSIDISEEMNASSSYNLKWSLMGYDSGYKSMIALFDCTDKAEGECATSYDSSEKFLESEMLSTVSTEDTTWVYKDKQATKFNYEYNVTIPDTRADGSDWNSTGTDIVIRFYVISKEDEDNNKSSLSLIIPGNLTDRYYDTSGRKIEKTICPSDGCSE